jgi:hypothetical protein
MTKENTMSIRKTALAAALAGALGGTGVAQAIEIQGITIGDGALFEFVLLAEGEQAGSGNGNGIIDATGEKLNGVVKVVEITDLGGNVLWSDSSSRELTGYFYDYVAEEIYPDTNTGEVFIGFSGGVINLWSDGTPNFERNGTQADDIAKAIDSEFVTPWLTLAGSPIGDGALPVTPLGLTTGSPITLRTSAQSLNAPGTTVLGAGLLDVTGGAAAAFLDTNTFNCDSVDSSGPCYQGAEDADKLFTTSGQLRAITAANDWGFLGTGEIQDVAKIPEPATVGLFSLGLLGLGYASRRKAKAELTA